VTLTTVLRLEDNAPGKALAQIGDPAVPVLIKVLNNKNVKERTRAVYALNLIGTPIAKNALRDQLNRESDPGLRDIILRTLDHWKAE
jgi:HEAT repeat protein